MFLFDEFAAAVRNPNRLAAFDLGCGTRYVGPGNVAENALIAFVFRFLARHHQDFLLQTEKKSDKYGCTVLFPYPLSHLPVPWPVDCFFSMLDCME